MKPDNRFSWRLAQSGRVSVTHKRHPGMVKNQIHIQCDCESDSLLSDIVSAEREGDVRPTNRAGKDATASPGTAFDVAAKIDSRGGKHQKQPAKEKTLVVRLKSAKHETDKLLLTDAKLVLQGEDVIVRDGVPYFQAKSQVIAQPSVGPPALLGSQVDQKALESLAAKDSQRNLYFLNSELLDGSKSIIRDPKIQFATDIVPMRSAVRRRTLGGEGVDSDELNKILPGQEMLRSIEAERSRLVGSGGQEVKSEDRQLNQVVMVNARCVLKDNCIAIQRGLLHVGRTWHRVINGKLVGSKAGHVTITGRPVYQDASGSSQKLMNSATLYSLGNTLYAGHEPLLEDAVLHADGQVISVSELPLGSLCGMPAPEKPDPPRLFVQGGHFSVQNTGLSVDEGTVWLQDVRMQLPEDTVEEVRVAESLVFISPATVGQDANKANEARDIIYADGMLLLDDLTPLLKDGFVCLGDQKQPLVWLSGDPTARSSQPPAPPKEELSDRVQMLTDGTCILDQHGMYFIGGSMILQDKEVLIERGVPLFSAETAAEIRKMHLGCPPPYLTGRVLLDAQTAKELGAKAIADFFVLKNVRLDMTDGKIILNNRAPVLSDCQLIMDRHRLSPMQLGYDVARGAAAAANAPGAVSAAVAADKAKIKAKEDSAPVSAGRAPAKTGVSLAGTSTADMEDSGRGTSDWAESSQRAATALGGVVETPGAKKPGSAATDSGKSSDAENEPKGEARADVADGRADVADGRADVADGRADVADGRADVESAGRPGGVQQNKTKEESSRDSDLDSKRPTIVALEQPSSLEPGQEFQSRQDAAETPSRLPAKSVASGKNIGIELGRDSVADARDSKADFGRDSVADARDSTADFGRDPVQLSGEASASGRRAESVGDASAKASRPTGGAGVEGRHEREVPAAATARPLGDISSNGISGNFSVISSSANKKLVFSLKARIDEMLSFLDQQS